MKLRLLALVLILLLSVSDSLALIPETGTLRGFVEGQCASCAYDNWASHVSEGIADSGYNNYGPSWFDPQTNGFGSFTFIPNDAGGDQTLAAWRAVFTFAVENQWTSVDSILALRDPLWNYESVELTDPELNRTFYLLRERLDNSFVDTNVDSIPGDDVIGSFRNGWGLFVFNPAASFPKLNIEMPHPEDDFVSLPVGLELFIRTDARAMMIAGAGREILWDTTHAEYANNYSLSDPSRNCRTPFAVCHEVLYDLLYAGSISPLVTIQQHSYDHAVHLNLLDVHPSAFADDNRPNPPLRDTAEHLDLIHFMGMTPVNGLPGYPEITAQINEYTALWSIPAYAFYSASDTIPISASNELTGAPSNCEGVYNHQDHNAYVDPENFIHCEIDEYPDQLWSPERWDLWLPGPMPATEETYTLVLAYYDAYITGLDSALRYTYLYPDTIPPVAVQLDLVIPVAVDSVRLIWSPPAADRFFDSYVIYYDTVEINDTSPSITRLRAGYGALWDYTLTSVQVPILAPPLDRCRFAIGSQDIWGNVAITSASTGISPGPWLLTTEELLSDSLDGDGNGLADFGEGIAFSLMEENVGDQDANAVTVRIASDDPSLTITDSLEYYGTVPARGQMIIPNGFHAELSPQVADSHLIQINITATDTSSGAWQHAFTVMAHAGKPAVQRIRVADSLGNGDGILNPGEDASLLVTLANIGSARMDSISAILFTDHPGVTVTQSSGSLNSLLPGSSSTLSLFDISLAESIAVNDRVVFYLELAMARGRIEHLLFELAVGGFYDSFENGQGGWTHQPNQTGWTDQWHLSTEMFWSPTHAWKCGSTTTGNYANHLDAVLVTPVINLPEGQELRFWHWMQAEVSGASQDSAYDGGIIEISVNGGNWEQLTPAGGYNKWIRCLSGGNPYSGPFACQTPCFSGVIPWNEVVCNLSAYSGPIQIRFHFGTDNGVTREGWYVDDVRIMRANSNLAPQNLQLAVGDTIAHLVWQSPMLPVLAGDLRGYNVYRDSVRIASEVAALDYSDVLSRLPYADYHYAVTAQYSDSESVFSNMAVAVWDSLPSVVADLTITTSGLDVILNWMPGDATYYYVLASNVSDNFNDATYTFVSAPPFIIVGGLSEPRKQFYQVIAIRD